MGNHCIGTFYTAFNNWEGVVGFQKGSVIAHWTPEESGFQVSTHSTLNKETGIRTPSFRRLISAMGNGCIETFFMALDSWEDAE